MQWGKMTDRLEAVFRIIPMAESIADVGTDHGYLAVELVARGKAQRVIAGDVNRGPLRSAERYITQCGLNHAISCRLGDGLTQIGVGEVKGAVICGMGGFLMRNIIAAGPERLEFYVLQPQNGQGQLRHYMVEQGYRIVTDIVMPDMNKHYQAFLALRKDCLPAYMEKGLLTRREEDEGVYVGQDFDESLDPYSSLSDGSVLWEAGLLAQASNYWKDHVGHLIYQRQCALDGMGESLSHTPKYQALQKEIEELKNL